MKLISLDIDGVLTDYPACWLTYLADVSDRTFETTDEARHALGNNAYELYKEAYRVSDYKAQLPMKSGSESFCRELERRGYEMIIATSRPPISRLTTQRWLAFHRIPYRTLIEKRLDETFPHAVKDALLHVDDELIYVDLLRKHDIPAWLLEENAAYHDILESLP